jgi:hypothetical protein
VAKVPDYLRLGFVCMTLSHRINRLGNSAEGGSLVETYFHYQGLILRSLIEDINLEHRQTSDFVIAGLVSFLLSDVSRIST